MSELKIGASVLYCGHEGVFVADIRRVCDVCVVVANGPVNGDMLNRDKVAVAEATHHLEDWPVAGYWGAHRGIFVVPHQQVTELKPVTMQKGKNAKKAKD